MHAKALPTGSRRVLEALSRVRHVALEGWTLAGGTGLALRLGHRLSDEFDFFRLAGMDTEGLYDAMSALGAPETLQRSANILTVLVQGAKFSFFQVREPFRSNPHATGSSTSRTCGTSPS